MRQIREISTLPKAQETQAKEATKSQQQEMVFKVVRSCHVGESVGAFYFGPRREKEGRSGPDVVTNRKGSHTLNVNPKDVPGDDTRDNCNASCHGRGYGTCSGPDTSCGTSRFDQYAVYDSQGISGPGPAEVKESTKPETVKRDGKTATPEYGPHNQR